MLSLTPIVGNNATGYIQTKTKLRRALKRRDKLLGTILQDVKKANISVNQGSEFPILIGKADTPRLIRVLESVARGLYFHNQGRRFIGTCHVVPGFVTYENESAENLKLSSRRLFDQEKHEWKQHSENPEVFYYLMGTPDRFGLTPMIMTFFSYSEVYVSFQPNGVNLPFDESH
jgi:hypothetical protein